LCQATGVSLWAGVLTAVHQGEPEASLAPFGMPWLRGHRVCDHAAAFIRAARSCSAGVA
jgi:hypothetical protein